MVNLRVYLTELGSGERISFCQYTLGTVIGIGPVDVLEIYGMPAGQCSDINADLTQLFYNVHFCCTNCRDQCIVDIIEMTNGV